MLRSLIGSTAEDVACRSGISAETVERIVENQLAEEHRIDPHRVITDIGLDELSLKKRHRLYVTLLTDLSDPTRPQILAVARGKDTAAALKCLDLLSEEQRQQVRTHRVDMGSAYPAACPARGQKQPRRDRPVPCGQAVQRGGRCPAKKLTREYKAKLTKAEREGVPFADVDVPP